MPYKANGKDNELKRTISEIKTKVMKNPLRNIQTVSAKNLPLLFDIGHILVENQIEFGWDRAIIGELSKALKDEFPSMRGFSPSHLWRIRNFYLTYLHSQKVAQLVRD